MTASNSPKKSTRREIIRRAGAATAVMAVSVHQAMAASGSDGLGNLSKPPSKTSKTTMSESNTISLEDHATIEAMLLHIFWLADHGHLDQVADFHTQDALVTSNAPSPYDRMQGRQAVREVGIKNPTPPGAMTRHIMTALQVTPNKDGSVETTCTVLRFSRTADSPLGMCLLEDSAQTLVRGEDGRWLISKRHVDILFPLAPGGGPRPGGPPGAPPGGPPGATPGSPNHN
jgi:SnoaL-like domain